jgi:alpha-mannosidase
MAFKQAEQNCDRWIMRFYECEGQPLSLDPADQSEIAWPNTLGLAPICPVDGLEQSQPQTFGAHELSSGLTISPWQIMSLALGEATEP